MCLGIREEIQVHRMWAKLCWFSVTNFCPTLCDSMDCSMPGFPVLHYLPEFAQTRVHWVSDAIQPSHPLSLPFPPALNLSQHRFQMSQLSASGGRSIGASASHQFFQWIFRKISFRIDWFDLFAVQGTLKGLLQYRSSKTSILHLFLLSSSHIYTKLLEKP